MWSPNNLNRRSAAALSVNWVKINHSHPDAGIGVWLGSTDWERLWIDRLGPMEELG